MIAGPKISAFAISLPTTRYDLELVSSTSLLTPYLYRVHNKKLMPSKYLPS
jgi:hypothetical protein